MASLPYIKASSLAEPRGDTLIQYKQPVPVDSTSRNLTTDDHEIVTKSYVLQS